MEPKAAENLKFMVLDDHLRMTQMVRSVLIRMGYRACISETDPRVAVERIRKEGVGFLICDWAMPGKSGTDVIKEMKQDPALADIPILMISGEADVDGVLEAVEAGVDSYLLKPFTPQDLKTKVEEILQERRQAPRKP